VNRKAEIHRLAKDLQATQSQVVKNIEQMANMAGKVKDLEGKMTRLDTKKLDLERENNINKQLLEDQ
jgi:hypothetical protein